MRYFLFGLFAVIFSISCTGPKSAKQSLLVIAVEGLGFEAMGCDQENLFSEKGFSYFCEESIRFTHAYTPSTSAQSTLASLLTGLYPQEHKLRSNGKDFLSGKFVTAPEIALKKGYSTFFSGGGVPIFSRSGLDQGFETYLDSPHMAGNTFYRSAGEVVDSFLEWKQGVSGPYFSVLYFNDTQFPWVTTKNARGELRAKGVRSQLAEINESIEYLINEMKKHDIWNSTHVILVGTSGQQTSIHDNYPKPLNLYSEHTQVALMIKPSRRIVDSGMQWKVDSNVSLVDIGRTLFDFFKVKPVKNSISELQSESLINLFAGQELQINEDRVILSESDWANFHKKGSRLVGLRKGHLLFFNTRPSQIYNSLVDRQEASAISKDDPTIRKEDLELFEETMETLGVEEWEAPDPSFIAKVQLGIELWSEKKISQDVYVQLFHLIKQNKKDKQIAGWLAYKLIKEAKWLELFTVGDLVGNSYWKKLGAANLGRNFPLVPLGCLKVFADNFELVKTNLRECDDELLLGYINWKTETDSSHKRFQWVKFLKSFRAVQNSIWVSRGNHVNALNWGADSESLSGPTLLEVFLLLPGNSDKLQEFTRELKRSSIKLGSNSLFIQFK